jgi:hypothetical protein
LTVTSAFFPHCLDDGGVGTMRFFSVLATGIVWIIAGNAYMRSLRQNRIVPVLIQPGLFNYSVVIHARMVYYYMASEAVS